MIDLDNARKVIAAEECRYDRDDPESRWCANHEYHWPSTASQCKSRPEVADVAAELLAAVKRVRHLADELEAANPTGRLIGKGIRDRLEGTEVNECQ